MAVTLPLLAASFTRDARLISAVSVAMFLPALLFGLHTGVMADRYDRFQLMTSANVIRALVMCGLAFAAWSGVVSIVLLCAVAIVLGTTDSLFDNAASAALPSVVPKSQLEVANSRLQAAQVAAEQFVGAPLGGVLFSFAVFGPSLAAAMLCAGAAALVRGIGVNIDTVGRRSFKPESDPPTMLADIREGVRWLLGHRAMRTTAMLLAAVNAAGAAVSAILVLYVLETLDGNSLQFSATLVALAAGAIGGSIPVHRVILRLGRAGALRTSVIGVSGGILIVGLSPWIYLSLVGFVLIGMNSMMWNVVTISMRQALVPHEILGRVTSAYRVIGLGSMPVAAAMSGWLASEVGVRSTIVSSAIFLLLCFALAAPFIRKKDFDPA